MNATQKKAARKVKQIQSAWAKGDSIQKSVEFEPSLRKREAAEARADKWFDKEQKYWAELTELVSGMSEEEFYDIEHITELEYSYGQFMDDIKYYKNV